MTLVCVSELKLSDCGATPVQSLVSPPTECAEQVDREASAASHDHRIQTSGESEHASRTCTGDSSGLCVPENSETRNPEMSEREMESVSAHTEEPLAGLRHSCSDVLSISPTPNPVNSGQDTVACNLEVFAHVGCTERGMSPNATTREYDYNMCKGLADCDSVDVGAKDPRIEDDRESHVAESTPDEVTITEIKFDVVSCLGS